MGYTVNIVVRDAKNLKRVSNFIAEMIENATGQKVSVRVHNTQKQLTTRQNTFNTINQKILK